MTSALNAGGAIAMRRPKVKPEHTPYRIAGNRVRIGGLSYGLAAEVKDPTGAVWTLLRSMDGSRGADEIVARVVAAHPDESESGVRAALERFILAGYVEDAGAPEPAVLSARERERYDRGRNYFRWVDLKPRASSWEPQLLLRRARVTVVGLGGTGGNAALALAASGVGRLTCLDRDVVELSNLNRQVLYTEADLDRPKAEAAADRLRDLNSDISVDGRRSEITGIDDVRPLLDDCDLLLLAADRPPEIRRWVNRACLASGTPWVEAGYHGPLVVVGVYVPGEGACYECLRAAQDARLDELGAHRADAIPFREDAVSNAVAAPSAGISGYLAAHAVLALLIGSPPLAAGQMHGVNLAALDHRWVLDDKPRADCPACGKGA